MENVGFLKKKYNTFLIAGLLSWVICIVGDMADSVLGGIFINEYAVAAIELVNPVFSILLFLCFFIGVSVSTLYSREMGAFNSDNAYKISGMGLLLSIVLGVLLSVLFVACEDMYFSFYTSSPAVEEYAREYYECFIILAAVYPLYWFLYYMLIADGDAVTGVSADIVNALANAAFSLILVNRTGIKGLGYGTVFAVLLSLIILLLHFFKKTNSIKFKFYFSFKSLATMLGLGSSVSLTYLYLAVVDIVMNKFIIVNFTDAYLPAYAVINLLLNLGGCFTCATSAASAFVSVCYGEKNPLGIKKAMRFATVSTISLGVVFTALLFALASHLPALYGISDGDIFASAVFAGKMLALSYLPTCFIMEWAEYLPKINRILLGNAVMAVYMFVAPLIFPMPLGLKFGFEGLTIGFFITPFVTVLCYFVYVALRYGIKKFPLLLPESDNIILVHELKVTEENIIALRDKISEELLEIGIDSHTVNKISLMIEETFMVVLEKNKTKGHKKVLGDCTVVISENQIHLITRDNGMIFDITDVNSEIASFGAYVTARLIENNRNGEYLTTTSFNRNSFVWNLNEQAEQGEN